MRKRHDLLDITDQGRCWASEHLAPTVRLDEDLQKAVRLITEGHDGVKVPGIVRREDDEGIQGAISVGFSSPFLADGKRIRVPTFVLPEEVVRTNSPYQVLEADFLSRTACLKALAEMKRTAADRGIKIGAWGSAGLEIYTGLPYTHAASDLDLLIGIAELHRILTFAEEAFAAGQRYGCRVDIELDLPSGYGINVLELLKGTDLILGKSLNGVELIHRSSILGMCHQIEAEEKCSSRGA
jgi:phosphoribosyl-dephospho-CoA transferase